MVTDIRIESPVTVRLTGKGNKSRIVPIMTPTASLVRAYINERNLNLSSRMDDPLFYNRNNQKLTRAGINYIITKHTERARNISSKYIPENVSSHTFRHSKAMHLLQAGINLIYIRDLLGHVSITTTEMKRKALETAYNNPAPEKVPPWQQNVSLLEWLKSLGN